MRVVEDAHQMPQVICLAGARRALKDGKTVVGLCELADKFQVPSQAPAAVMESQSAVAENGIRGERHGGETYVAVVRPYKMKTSSFRCRRLRVLFREPRYVPLGFVGRRGKSHGAVSVRIKKRMRPKLKRKVIPNLEMLLRIKLSDRTDKGARILGDGSIEFVRTVKSAYVQRITAKRREHWNVRPFTVF